MEKTSITNTNIETSRIGLGTWAIGGTQWGGTDEDQAVKTIEAALDKGINLIDTAPGYGYGKAEEIVGKAINQNHHNRGDVVISTKAGMNWTDEGDFFRDSTKARIHQEVEDSLKRLGTDYIDLYHIHWPDPLTPIYETAEALNYLYRQGKIKAIGVSNYTTEQIDVFQEAAPLHTIQVPHNLFERDSEKDILPYAHARNITALYYSSLTRGMLSGKIHQESEFTGDDIRKSADPKFQGPYFQEYLQAVEELDDLAQDRFGKSVAQLALKWNLQQPGNNIALWGMRHPEQLQPLNGLWDFEIDSDSMKDIDEILMRVIKKPVGPEFMAPPDRQNI
ncbi:aldo/keto reductase [Sediminibacillus massiliensis]|uniref:aldo/keto reductase n=1 Tax=Sediminibacillus massiliensis TaxID=1926277 RepID=UPI0009884C0C|nr:aldo/keto reductase [Sediminibacillus massiliensis]